MNKKNEKNGLSFDFKEFLNSEEYKNDVNSVTMFNSYKDNEYLFRELKDSDNEEYTKAIISQLVKNNESLVKSIAIKYLGQAGTLTLDDLLSEGNIGLLKAMKKFDVDKEFKFSTYATWWIRQTILRSIADTSLTIRLPVHRFDTIKKIRNYESKMIAESKFNINDLLSEFDITYNEYEKIKMDEAQFMSLASLNTIIGEEEDNELLNFISSKTFSMIGNDVYKDFEVESLIEYEFLKINLTAVLETLTEREHNILILRFGLDDGNERTLEEIGKIFGVTRERIRQIEATALNKLRQPSKSKFLIDYIVD